MDASTTVVYKIKNFLNSKHIRYTYIEHEPTPTSEDSARVRNTKEQEGAKAIILKLSKDHKNVMVVLPGDLKIDTKKIKKVLESDSSFESPEVILERYGVVVGGVPPFGNLLGEEGMQVLIDEKLFLNETIAFNCGKTTASIIMGSADYRKAIEQFSIIGDFAK